MSVYFDMPELLPLALVLPALVATLLIVAHRKRVQRIARLGSDALVGKLLPDRALQRPLRRVMMLSLAGCLAAIAVAGPRWGTGESRITGSGVDIVFAIDASLSMLATDERPTRLDRVKQEIRRFRANSRGDRIGVIAFAGRSYILTPLTTDQGALDLFLDNLDPSIVGQAGSSVSRAIKQGSDLLLASQSASDRALVIFSDWESFEEADQVMTEAKAAGEAGVSVVAVGFGTAEGSRIPVVTGGRNTFKLDENGRVVVTRHNPELMKATAAAASGIFIDASETDKASRIRHAMSSLRTQQRSLNVGRDRVPRFQLFLLPALALMLVDTLLVDRQRLTFRNRVTTGSARRSAATASLAVMLIAPRQLGNLGQDKAAVLVRDEMYMEAVTEYRERIQAGDRTEKTQYNLGTALLRADSLTGAIETLGRLTRAEDAEVRYRAMFNLGLAQLRMGRAKQGREREDALDEALESYRNVLLMRPGDMDAKWNYELALHEKDESSSGGGGGQDDQQNQSNQQNQQSESQDQRSSQGGIGREQAEQILDNAARDERDVRSRSQDRNRPARPPGGKDW